MIEIRLIRPTRVNKVLVLIDRTGLKEEQVIALTDQSDRTGESGPIGPNVLNDWTEVTVLTEWNGQTELTEVTGVTECPAEMTGATGRTEAIEVTQQTEGTVLKGSEVTERGPELNELSRERRGTEVTQFRELSAMGIVKVASVAIVAVLWKRLRRAAEVGHLMRVYNKQLSQV